MSCRELERERERERERGKRERERETERKEVEGKYSCCVHKKVSDLFTYWRILSKKSLITETSWCLLFYLLGFFCLKDERDLKDCQMVI